MLSLKLLVILAHMLNVLTTLASFLFSALVLRSSFGRSGMLFISFMVCFVDFNALIAIAVFFK